MAVKNFLRRTHLRALAFGVVLVLVSGLILGLFQSAGAVEMRFEEAPASIQGDATYVVDLKIEKGQRVPIRSIEAILEEKSPTSPSKRGAILTAHVACPIAPVPGHACPRDAPFQQASASVPLIRFQGAHSSRPDGPALGYSDIFGNGRLSGTTTGYGFDEDIGYGGQAGAPTPFDGGVGFGYGTATATLYLRYEITVSACRTGGLGSGTYYLTAIANTGLELVAETLSSPYTQFQVNCLNGYEPSRTGTDSVRRMAPISARDGALAAYSHTILNAPAGTPYQVAIPDALLTRLELQPARALQDVPVDLARYAATARPEDATPAGLQPHFATFALDIPGEHASVRTATILARVPSDVVTDPQRALLLRLRDGAWSLESNPTLTLVDGGAFEAELADACCGVYAFGMDTQRPRIQMAAPTQPIAGNVTFRADATDGVGITQVSFYLDAQLRHVDDFAPYEFPIDTRQHSDGTHRIRAVAYDFGGLDAEAIVDATFDN